MTIQDFIDVNREELDDSIQFAWTPQHSIRKGLQSISVLNDKGRVRWIMTDTDLRDWARSEGVRI